MAGVSAAAEGTGSLDISDYTVMNEEDRSEDTVEKSSKLSGPMRRRPRHETRWSGRCGDRRCCQQVNGNLVFD